MRSFFARLIVSAFMRLANVALFGFCSQLAKCLFYRVFTGYTLTVPNPQLKLAIGSIAFSHIIFASFFFLL